MTAPAALEVANLRFSYGRIPVLADVNLSLGRGEHHLLLGRSGSGKTTLINLIGGLLTPHTGAIYIAGEAMTGPAAARDDLRRRQVGMVFQTLRLVRAISVSDNLRLAQRLAGRQRDEAEIAALLQELALGHRASFLPRQLSQGEAQRAAIGRALIARPALLIADEPTSALDDENADRIARLLVSTANAQGSTLLIATHDSRLRAHVANVLALDRQAEAA
jgi:putative ABC transport system ATP-binding protein